MSEPTDFTHLDDPAFLNERARLRGWLEHLPEDGGGRAELERLYEAMTDEFLLRARVAWTPAPAGMRHVGPSPSTCREQNGWPVIDQGPY
jgi:hypothetical protein